jgi:RNA polymerase sigma-70 factor (ECF subfamily)
MLKDHIDMLAQIENDDNVAHLRKAIDTLPHMQKEALVLRFVYELKFREIARITNSSTSTVKSRIYQGLAKLKKILLEDKYFEDR